MDAQLLFHIGANKTGSSAIQSFLRQNWKSLRTLGFIVPDRELGVTDRVTGEHVFALQDMFNRSDRAGLESRIRALAKTDAKAIIISAENLSNGGNFQFFHKILQGMDCKAILYIRRQDELLTSSWQQWNSKTETDINAWIVLALQRLGHWLRCIEGWESVVGPGNVVVRVFQRSDMVKGNVVDDFISLLDAGEPAQPFQRNDSLVNPSYSDLITPIVSGNRFIFGSEHDNDFYNMVAKLTGDHYAKQKKISLISQQQRDKIIEYYRPQNEAVCRKYFPGRPRLFESVDHANYDYLSRDELTKKQLEFLASLIFAMYKRQG